MHVGAPDSVFAYGIHDDDANNDDGNGANDYGLSTLERAISVVLAPQRWRGRRRDRRPPAMVPFSISFG